MDLYYEANNTFIVSTGGCNTVPNNLWCNSIQGPNQARWIRNNNSTQTLAHYLANDPNDPAPLSSISPAGGLFVWSPEGGGAFYYFGTPDFYMLVFQLENASHPIKAKNGVVPDADRGGTVRVNGVCMYDYSRYVGDDRVVIVGKNNSKNSCN
ncbi:MAG: hypothetical protein BWY68_00838 [bacterium ADurb.Bin400]|nr:MAG: hypothetical protein BWY68_00838 [bacterium ADurb.Bin400]